MKKQKPRLQQKKVAKPSARKAAPVKVEQVKKDEPVEKSSPPATYEARVVETGHYVIGDQPPDIIYDAMAKEIEDLKMQLGIANARSNNLQREVDAYERLAVLLKEERAKQEDSTLGIRQPARTDDLPSLNDMKPLPALD